MAAPILIGLGKALLSQAPKIAAKQLGKKAVKNAAKDFVKGKVKDKLKGKKKKKGGALVRSEDITSTAEQVNETSQKISPQKLLPSSVDTTTSSAVISPSGKTSYEKISQRLDNIIGITGALDKAFKQQLKDKKKTAKATQNARQTERKKAREEKLEQGKKSLGIGAAAMSAAKKFGLMDFITNVLLGGLILFLLKQAPKIEKIFNFLTENLYASFLIIRGVLQAFKGAFKQFGKIVRGILKTGVRIATKPFRMAGSAIASGFRRLGNAIFNFARMSLNLIRRGLGLRPIPKSPDKGGKKRKGKGKPSGRKGKTKATPTGSGAGKALRPAGFVPRSDARGNQVAGKGRQYRQNLARTQVSATTTPARASRLAGLKANLQTGTAFGGRGANLQRGAYGAVIKGNNFLRKLFNIVNPKEIQALADASPALKKAGNFMKGARIPVVGPLIVFTVNALDPTQSLGQAAFKAIGAGLGEFLGFAIPIPILGPILGGLVGEVMGDVAYSLIINKNPKEAGQKIMNAVGSVGDIGGKILEWAKGLAGRFWEALPKKELPDWIPFGLGGMKVLDPNMFSPGGLLGLKNAIFTMGGAFLTALFQPKKKEKGKVEKSQEDVVKESSKVLTETEFYNAGVEDTSLGIDYQEYLKSKGITPMSMNTVSAGGPEGYTSSLMPKSKKSKFYAAMGINEQMWKTYKDTIASIETSGYSLDESYKAIGGSGGLYDGRYQMGKMASIDAAQALGIPTPSRSELRNNPQLQEDMFLAYTYKNYTYMTGASTQFDNASNVQKLQYLGYAHNQGHAYATDWLKTGVISSVDGFGTKGTKFTDKLAKTLKPYLSGEQPQQSTQSQQLQTSPISDRKPTPDNSDKLKPTSEQQQTATPVQPSSSTASQNASQVSRSASYEDGAEQTIIIPSPSQQQQQPMMTPQQSGSVIRVGGSTKDVLNSYYKAQLLGFLYKQG